MQKKLQQNVVYELAKKIAATTDEKKQEKLLDKLSDAISQHFESKESAPIEEAISTALNAEQLEVCNIIMDEAYLEIESLCFDDDNGTSFESTMQLLPCTITTDNNSIVVPSIDTFQQVIRKHLVKQQIILEEDQFHLGAILLNEDDLANFKFQDWWNIHRGIIETDAFSQANPSNNRDQKIKLIPDATVSLFFLVPILVDKNDNRQLFESVYNSFTDIETWREISEELSSDDFEITTIPPMGIAETIQQSNYILQDIEFNVFFDEQTEEEEDTEVGYIQLTDDPNEYVVLFYNSTDRTLNQFYHYGTQGDGASFASLLVEKCIKNNNTPLVSFEDTIDMNTLDGWTKSSEPVSIDNLLKKSNVIDLSEAYRMSTINNPNTSPEMDSYSQKRTLH
jgi:hypothetical protein